MGKKLNFLPEAVEMQIDLDNKGKLHFPVLLLYDEYMQTDFIQDWQEDQTVREVLTPIFCTQAPWDSNHDYTMQTIEVYIELDQTKPLDGRYDLPEKKATKKYQKVALNETLIKILQNSNYIIPQYPILKIISNESDFKDSFLKEI